MPRLFKTLLLATFVTLTGCAYKVDYNPSYISLNGLPKIEGDALIYTHKANDDMVYKQNPTSLTGGATTLEVKVGDILKNSAQAIFERVFTKGAKHTNDPDERKDYSIVIEPKIANYEYRYNQLKNIGFAITPEVLIGIHVTLMDGNGDTILDKMYSTSGYEDSGGTYVVNFTPEEGVNEAIHKKISELLKQAAYDIENSI